MVRLFSFKRLEATPTSTTFIILKPSLYNYLRGDNVEKLFGTVTLYLLVDKNRD